MELLTNKWSKVKIILIVDGTIDKVVVNVKGFDSDNQAGGDQGGVSVDLRGAGFSNCNSL